MSGSSWTYLRFLQLISNMKVVPLRLPPLPCKNITVSLKNPNEKTEEKEKPRKYSVQHLETTDDPDEATTCTGSSSTKIQRPPSKASTESCKSIRIRDHSAPARKLRKATSIEEHTYSDLPPHVTAKSWILYEMKSGKTLYGKRAKKQRQMASLTKIMNLITFLELLDRFSLSPKSLKVRATKVSSTLEGTTAEIRHSAQYNLDDLLYGMMLPSGNDAAFLVAEVGGYISQKKGQFLGVEEMSAAVERRQGCYVNAFLREMNSLAQKVGMVKSNFANVHGLSNSQNISCAEDLAKLCAYAMRNRKFRKVVQTQKFHYSCLITQPASSEDEKNGGESISEKVSGVWENTNKMLGEGWSGIKTGITPNAGPCLAASLFRCFSGKEYEFLVILLDSQSMEARWDEVQKLVDWAITTRQYV